MKAISKFKDFCNYTVVKYGIDPILVLGCSRPVAESRTVCPSRCTNGSGSTVFAPPCRNCISAICPYICLLWQSGSTPRPILLPPTHAGTGAPIGIRWSALVTAANMFCCDVAMTIGGIGIRKPKKAALPYGGAGVIALFCSPITKCCYCWFLMRIRLVRTAVSGSRTMPSTCGFSAWVCISMPIGCSSLFTNIYRSSTVKPKSVRRCRTGTKSTTRTWMSDIRFGRT